MTFPKELFGKAWIIDKKGAILESKITGAYGEKINALKITYNDGCAFTSQERIFTYKEDTGFWIYLDEILVFELESDKIRNLINDRIIEYTKKSENDYREAFDTYMKRMKDVCIIQESNNKFLNK